MEDNKKVLEEMENKDLKKAFQNFADRSISKIHKRINNANAAFAMGGMASLSVTSLLVNSTTGLAPEALTGFGSGVAMGLIGVAALGAATSIGGFISGKLAQKDLEKSGDYRNLVGDFEIHQATEEEKIRMGSEKYTSTVKTALEKSLLAKELKATRMSYNEARNDNVEYDAEKAGLTREFKNFKDRKMHSIYKRINNSNDAFALGGMVALSSASVLLNSTSGLAPELLSNLSAETTMALTTIAVTGAITSVAGFAKSKIEKTKLETAQDYENIREEFANSLNGDSRLTEALTSTKNAFKKEETNTEKLLRELKDASRKSEPNSKVELGRSNNLKRSI